MLIYELPATSFKCRAQPNVIRRNFEPHDQMLYHRTILEPHTAYPIPAGTKYIVVTVQKIAFGLDIIPESLLPQLIQKGFHVGYFRKMKNFDQTPYKLPPPIPIHVPTEKRSLEEKSLPKKRVRITPVMRRVSRRPELPMAPVQIPQVPKPLYSSVPCPRAICADPSVTSPVVTCADSTCADSTCADSRCSRTCADSSLTSPTVICADSTCPTISCADSSVPCPRATCEDSSVTSPTVICADSTCADSTCADSKCSRICADFSVTSPTATYADSTCLRTTCADSTCIRNYANSSVTSPTVTCAVFPKTYTDSPRAGHFGAFGVNRCIRPDHVVRIWTLRTPDASHGTLYF
ncbi:uncharacterized protein TNCV_2456721 [Trichonephila clavipes]|nr:uncharacterized protein TNCV_2456721 [Trichonephila clavipes]